MASRGDSCYEVAELLLESVVARSNFEPFFAGVSPSESPRKEARGGDWVVEEYAAVAASSEAAADGLVCANTNVLHCHDFSARRRSRAARRPSKSLARSADSSIPAIGLWQASIPTER